MKFTTGEFCEKIVQAVRLLSRSKYYNEYHTRRPTCLAAGMSFKSYRTEKSFAVRVKDGNIYLVCITHILLS
jgi:hypothetical protein